MALEVPNEGNGKKGVRRDVMDEGTSSRASTRDKLQSMGRGLDHGKIDLGSLKFMTLVYDAKHRSQQSKKYWTVLWETYCDLIILLI